jgi:3-deoxy-manno-octulosonate cytidylyltransferase (CMP-KDO synthetase)
VTRTVVIIPARWGSVRFPGKALAEIAGKPLIRHTWERCAEASLASRVIVATDDERIAAAAAAFGAEVAMTSRDHPTGSDRLAEVAAGLGDYSHVLNVQGDEPTIPPKLIDRLITEIEADDGLEMITAATPFRDAATADDPNNVKVVINLAGDALYFSRSRVPSDRDGTSGLVPLHHLGIYGYRRSFLLDFVQWEPTALERCEQLEQLRALDHGVRIRVVRTDERTIGVDTPADVALAEAALASSTRAF